MVKLTNLSTANIAIAGSNLAPGQSKDIEVINASLDRLIQGGALRAEPVEAPKVSIKPPLQMPAKTFKPYKKENS